MLQKLKLLLPHKLKATAVHLTLSLAIFAVILYVMLRHWYPAPWFALDGGWQGVRIAVLVDLVLGPVLTFLIFNPQKTRLALGVDFSFIAVVQACALAWGVYVIHMERPLAIAYSEGMFFSAYSQSLVSQGLDERALAPFGDRLPVLVYCELPKENKSREELFKKLAEGAPVYAQIQLMRPLRAHLDKVFEIQVDIESAANQSPDFKSALDRLISEHPGSSLQDFRYVRFAGRYEDATLVFKPDGTLVGSLPHVPHIGMKTPAPKTGPIQNKGIS